MKFAALFSVLAVAAATAGAVSSETNAQRLARGLPPNPPARRHPTRAFAARRGAPSGHPGGNCNVEKIHCCNSVTHSSDKTAQTLASLLGAVLQPDVAVGITCHPLSVLGVGGNSCNAQPVCCENNNFNGIIAVGCSPININA